ncbi:MAG TPA: carboxypeptidase-like regulatory domain-containing protein, partial [Rhodanobacter sp.]|nr:carboxypeptidase-like regulatory domain-containing protein [Rhodanobacter sp.]
MNQRYQSGVGTTHWRRTALAVALGLSFSGLALAQSTVGSIFGQAPAASGETVVVSNASGFSREVPVDSTGRYRVDHLPVGTYTVTLKQNGTVVSTHENAYVTTGGAAGIDFASSAAASSNAKELSSVTVTANALPAIDVTNVNSSTVITSADLKRLPVAHSAEAIALLSPNTTSGSGFFRGTAGQSLVSFGGSS